MIVIIIILKRMIVIIIIIILKRNLHTTPACIDSELTNQVFKMMTKENWRTISKVNVAYI